MQVENRVVGAPCGVMDQMASACGEANKLLAMVCQVSKCCRSKPFLQFSSMLPLYLTGQNLAAACRSEGAG